MIAYIVRRLLLAVLTVWAILTALVYVAYVGYLRSQPPKVLSHPGLKRCRDLGIHGV